MSETATAPVAINERAAEEFFKRGQDAETHGQHEKAVEFYERALQDDLSDEGGGFHVYDCFQKFVGKENEILREFYFASMTGVSARLSKAVDRFEIVEA